MKSTLFSTLLAAAALPAMAQSPASLSPSQDWRRLVIYEADGGSPSGQRSAIHSPEFFLAADGATNPEAELQATLAAMLLPAADNPAGNDSHAKCRFPARRLWLQRELPAQAAALADIPCPAFEAWAQPRQVDSVSLVFANGYLGNPASYYGHTFIKFNHSKASASSSLLDSTLNYGALAAQHDDPVSYIVKGLAGGYDGGFSPIEFYFHNATYNETELRDMWEYRLALPDEALRLVVAHAWEVTQKKYTYYFLRTNCAYRVAELLEIASGLHIIPRNRPWVMPQVLMQNLAQLSHEGKPLVSEVIYHPSRQSRLYGRYAALSGQERALTAAVAEQSIAVNSPQLQALPVARRQAVIDTLLEYYQFSRERSKDKAGSVMPADYVAALKERFAMPPGDTELPPPRSAAPGSGRAPSYVQAIVSRSSQHGHAAELRIRPAYYDTLDSSSSQPQNSALSMFDTVLAYDEGRWRIRRLDLFAIDSMNTAVTGLPGDKASGWRFAVGVDEESAACLDCRVARMQGDVGIGYELPGTGIFTTAYAGGALQAGAEGGNWGFARIGASVLLRPGGPFGLRMSHELRRYVQPGKQPSRRTTVEGRVALAKDYDLRLQWTSDTARRLGFGVGYYW